MTRRKLLIHRKVEIENRFARGIESLVRFSRLDVDNGLYRGGLDAQLLGHFAEVVFGQTREMTVGRWIGNGSDIGRAGKGTHIACVGHLMTGAGGESLAQGQEGEQQQFHLELAIFSSVRRS